MQTVLVTGANRGLGLEFTRQYAADGWQVYATTREPKKSEELRKIAAVNAKVSVEELDITDDQSVRGLAVALDRKPLDVLILNSGGLSKTRAEYWPDRLPRLARGI